MFLYFVAMMVRNRSHLGHGQDVSGKGPKIVYYMKLVNEGIKNLKLQLVHRAGQATLCLNVRERERERLLNAKK